MAGSGLSSVTVIYFCARSLVRSFPFPFFFILLSFFFRFCALVEITHGFDDKGRQFDKDGNMMQWWNNATIRSFRERAQCIIDQYSRYRIDEVGLYMNGRMTQGNLSIMA
jgi:hypothetical protein